MMAARWIIHSSLLQIDCSQNKAVFITQTADSKQPSMGCFFGAEKYIFWQPMAARLSISLWQFYGTQMAAILRTIDSLQSLAAFLHWLQMQIYSISELLPWFRSWKKKSEKRKEEEGKLNMRCWISLIENDISISLKTSLFEWSYQIESVGGCLINPTFIAIDIVIGSHWESVDNSNFMLYKLWCNQIKIKWLIDQFF